MTVCYIISNIATPDARLHFRSDNHLSSHLIQYNAQMAVMVLLMKRQHESHFHSLSKGMLIHWQLGKLSSVYTEFQ